MSVSGTVLTDGELLPSKVKQKALLLLVVAKSRPTDTIGFSLSSHVPVLLAAHQD